MQPAPPNKMVKANRWPRAKPAHEAYERACERVSELEQRKPNDSPAMIAARQAVAEAGKAYRQAVLADKREFPDTKWHGLASPRIKCQCGLWLDPQCDGPRCPYCNRRLPDVVRR